MAILEGDGPEGQPAEGEVTLESLAASMDSDDTPGESDESEGSEQPEEADEEGESEPTEDDDSEEEAEEPTFTIKHDGKEVALKQSELIDMAQQGFDYSKKTMALAEERKAIEPIRQQAEEYRKQQEVATTESVARLEAYSKFLEGQIGEPPPIAWAQQDAAYYLAAKEQYETKKGQLQQAMTEVKALRDEQNRKRQSALDAKAEATLKTLADTLPGWSDASVGEIGDYLKNAGIRPDTNPDAFVESGLWLMAHKAKAFDALQAEKAKLKPVNQLTKVHKPSGQNQPPQLARRQEAMKAHRAKPSVESLANLL